MKKRLTVMLVIVIIVVISLILTGNSNREDTIDGTIISINQHEIVINVLNSSNNKLNDGELKVMISKDKTNNLKIGDTIKIFVYRSKIDVESRTVESVIQIYVDN